MAQVYKPEEVDREIDRLLPQVNKGSELPIPRELARALFMVENMDKNGNVNFRTATSPKEAAGVAQVIPDTLRGLKRQGYLPGDFPEDLNASTLGQQVHAGLAAIKEFVTRYKTTDPEKIAALYNAGDKRAKKFLETGNTMYLPAETQMYLPKLQKAYEMQGVQMPIPPTVEQVAGPSVGALSGMHMDAAQQLRQNLSLFDSVVKAMVGGNDAAKAAGQMQVAAVQQQAAAAGEVARLEAENLAAIDATQNKLLKAAGLDILNPESAINVELQRSADARVRREQLDSRITELQSKSLFTDPIGYIMAIPEIAQLVPQYNQQATLENNAIARIRELQGVGATVKSLTPANSVELLRAKAAAIGKEQLARAQAVMAEIQYKNAGLDAKLFLDQYMLKDNAFKSILALEDKDANKFLRQMGIDERNERQAAKMLADKQEDVLTVGINKIREMIAGPQQTPVTKEFVKQMRPEERQMWQDVLLRGSFGDLKTAAAFIDRYGNESAASGGGAPTFNAFMRNTRILADQRAQEILKQHNKPGTLNKLDKQSAITIAYDELLKSWRADADGTQDLGSMQSTSPYAIDFEAAAAAAKANPNSSVSKALLTFKQASPYASINTDVTPRSLFSAVEAEVLAGGTTPQKAALELSGFFKTMEDQQFADRGLGYLGLVPMKQFKITPGATGKVPVDLFNPTAVEEYFTAQTAARRAFNIKRINIGRSFGGGQTVGGNQ